MNNINQFVMKVAIVATVSFLLTNCNSNNKQVPLVDTTKIIVGIQNSPSNSLVIIAGEKGFFDSTKVSVEIKEFSAGKFALQTLLGATKDLDVASCAETPIVLSSLGGNKMKVISQIVDAHNECRVVVRVDGNKDTPEKYFSIKRKLATSQGGSPEWLTQAFIDKYKLNKSKIEIIAMKPEDMPVAVGNGSIDAVSIFDPYARLAEKNLADKGKTFLNTDISSFYVLTVREEILKDKSEALKELLRGLSKAQAYIKSNPEEAKKIIAAKTHLDLNIINETWANYNFGIGLDSGLYRLCDAEARWAIETGKYPKETIKPNFKNIIIADILNAVSSTGNTP